MYGVRLCEQKNCYSNITSYYMSLPSYRDVPAVDVVVADRVNDVELGDVDEAGVVGTHR